jgi:hypothetical protein
MRKTLLLWCESAAKKHCGSNLCFAMLERQLVLLNNPPSKLMECALTSSELRAKASAVTDAPTLQLPMQRCLHVYPVCCSAVQSAGRCSAPLLMTWVRMLTGTYSSW